MRKIICGPSHLIPEELTPEIKYFCTYSNISRDDVGSFGSDILLNVKRLGVVPSLQTWDFLTIALSVIAADTAISRGESPDGWTREISLTIHLSKPQIWEKVKTKLQKILRFLTGDFWYLSFKDGGEGRPQIKKSKEYDSDCICLLSGGVDSLIGALNLVAEKKKPIFISQTVKGDAETQRRFAREIRSESLHLQWSHKTHLPTKPQKESEGSTRGRSIIFFAFAAIAASAIKPPAKIYVPENGFISLNIPLTPGRMGSLSTKTTHPVYLGGLNEIFEDVGINIELVTPYKFKTKGEMLSECLNKKLLLDLVMNSTSCGKYLRNGHQHCGRCVPCMVRKAAFLAAGIKDETAKGYRFELLEQKERGGAGDLGAMAVACANIQVNGIQHIISGNLSFASNEEKTKYTDVVERGFSELEDLLSQNGVT